MSIAINIVPKPVGGLFRSILKIIGKRVAMRGEATRADVRGLTKRGRPRPLEDK